MSSIVDRLFKGSRWEPLARELFALVGPRDQAVEVRDTHAMEQILRYVLLPTSNCIDVGASRGDYVRRFLELAPQGAHYAFEPLPEMAEGLRRQFPQVTVRQAALSDKSGESPFHHVTTNPGYSGLRRRTYDRPHEEVEIITVRTERLDDVLPADYALHLMKVDVEGAELQVFRGGLETLQRCRPYLLFEHGLGGADHYGTTPELVYDLLVDQAGLRIFPLDGTGALSREAFSAIFASNRMWNFLAHP